jgi:hypothetical protein
MVGCQCRTYVRLADTTVATATVVALADRKFKRPKASRRATLAGASQASQDGGGEYLGEAGGMVSGRATWDGWRRASANVIALAQRGEIPRRCAHVAPASTRDGVG